MTHDAVAPVVVDDDRLRSRCHAAMARCCCCCRCCSGKTYESPEPASVALSAKRINFSEHIRNHYSFIARNVIRKRLASRSSISSATLIHRSTADSEVTPRTAGDAPNAYSSLLFLTSDVILAADEVGGIGAFRLQDFIKSGGSATAGVRLPITPHQQQQRGVVKYLKQLKNGEAFLTCTKTGDIQLYDTEWYSDKYILQREVQGPKRRFFRHSNFSLHDMTKNTNNFYKIPDWEITTVRPINYCFYRNNNNIIMNNSSFMIEGAPTKRPSLDSVFRHFFSRQQQFTMMDCFENHCSNTIVVAVVDPDMDCFYVQYLSNDTTRFMCVPILKPNEYITSICFLSETTILTSHVITTTSNSPDEKFHNCLKEWDLRKMSTGENNTCYEPTESYCHLPSFPLEDNVRQMTSAEQYNYTNKDVQGGQWVPACAASSNVSADDWIVTSLQGPTYKSLHQHLMLTSCNLSQLPITTNRYASKTTHLDERKRIVDSWEHHSFCQETSRAVPQFIAPSITPDMQLMACYDGSSKKFGTTSSEGPLESGEDLHTFLIFDVTKRFKLHAAYVNHEYDFNNYSARKKQRSDRSPDNLAAFRTRLYDEYGLASSVCCIALNPMGNNFAIATTDGDIFLLGC